MNLAPQQLRSISGTLHVQCNVDGLGYSNQNQSKVVSSGGGGAGGRGIDRIVRGGDFVRCVYAGILPSKYSAQQYY